MVCLALGLAIVFAPRKSNSPVAEVEETGASIPGFESILENAEPAQKNIFMMLDSLKRLAEKEKTEIQFQKAADEFLRSARFFNGEEKKILYAQAITFYENVLSRNKENLSAKTNLGATLVESSTLLGHAPMRGITILKEVLIKDSNNVEANVQLGFFSVTSHQYTKAIERFKKVLSIDSTRIDMYVYLGDTYLSIGEKQNAIQNFKAYQSLVSDSTIASDIQSYIEKIESSNP